VANRKGALPDPIEDKANVIAPPPLIAAVALAVGYLGQRLDPRPMLPEAIAPWLGIGLLLVSLVIATSALGELHKARTPFDPRKATTAIVRTGAFRFSRNPLYVSLALVYLGVAALCNSLWMGLLFLPVLGILRFGVIGREERYLERKFGDEYRRYRAGVRRWL